MKLVLELDQKDTAMIRRTEGRVGYVAFLGVRGPRGARYRPVRSAVCVTEEAAEARLADLRVRFVRGKQLFAFGRVVEVRPVLVQEVEL